MRRRPGGPARGGRRAHGDACPAACVKSARARCNNAASASRAMAMVRELAALLAETLTSKGA